VPSPLALHRAGNDFNFYAQLLFFSRVLLLYRHALGEVTRLVDIGALENGDVVGQ
jgi:hypothetical protein